MCVYSAADEWVQVAHRQLSGIIAMVFVHRSLQSVIGDTNTCAVRLGFMGIGGNKGAVGIRLLVHGNSICFINGHFTAHQVNALLLPFVNVCVSQ